MIDVQDAILDDEIINGQRMITMDAEAFYGLFLLLAKHQGIDEYYIDAVKKDYEKAKKQKRKRVRKKKRKEIFSVMAFFMFEYESESEMKK